MGSLALSDIPDDEWDIDFDDNIAFIETRWKATYEQCRRYYSQVDYAAALSVPTPTSLRTYLREIGNRYPDPLFVTKTVEVVQALGVFRELSEEIQRSIQPRKLDFAIVWGSMKVLVESSLTHQARFESIVDVFSAVRRLMVRINLCAKAFKEEQKETRLGLVEAMETFVVLLAQIQAFIYEYPTDMSQWPRLNDDKIGTATKKLYGIVEQLHELAATTRLTEERQAKYLQYRDTNSTGMEDPDIFPRVVLPHRRNANFYGREKQLLDIDEYLNPQTARTLRTFTIYGRRGVGKTNIALEYAHRNPSNFDAVFWIRCETAASLRTSFLDMALALKLGGASTTTHHEEILILCQRWMQRTDKFWLLIFDNAEDEELLKNYWPKSKGAIIITSRRLINFSNHAVRTGQTIPTFNFQDGWELFIRSVGWEEKVANHELSTDELKAIEELVREFDGLPLSIDQAASLLTTSRFASARSLLDAFRHAKTVVNPRPTHVHSKTNHAIDAIWHVVFESLGNPNARRLLSVLCLLSPDTTYVDVFQPKNQSVLTPYTEFLRRETGSVAQSSQSFRDAMAQLVDAGLIKREGRILTIHRVVQEAFFFVNKAEHAESFFAVARLVYEAFPKQYKGRPLHGQWERCERFIPEAISLCGKYRDFLKSGESIPYPAEFCPLLINSAWFLFEVGDYTEIFKILEIAKRVCEDKTSINYAHLQNIEGVCYFEFNNLRDCRAAYESAFRIRSLHLPEDDEELTDSTHNLGNLEHAEGNYQKALEHFDKARTNRTNLGDEAQVPLSLTVMGIGRTYESMKRYADAATEFEEAEGLILGAMGQGSPFMANLHYSRGNLDRATRNLAAARASYDKALKVLNNTTPTHLMVSCVHYKIACVEFDRGNSPSARRHLDAALEIGNLRRLGPDDGHIARIQWKRAEMMAADPWQFSRENNQDMVAAVREEAELMRNRLERTDSVAMGLSDQPDETTYNNLVCGYFR